MDIKSILFSFSGRVPRKTYWLFTLAVLVINVIAGILDAAMVGDEGGIPVFTLFLSLALIWPCLAVSAKRWHDRDKSAWWMLIAFVPVIGVLWALVETGFLPGTEGDNRFGAPATAS